jgi:hypothetical protein
MVRIPEFDTIEFLIERKFRPTILAALPSRMGPRSQDRLEEMDSYRAMLKAMPSADLETLCRSEQTKDGREQVERAQMEEEQRFFNQPHATADFEHWSRAAHWTLDEATSLAFGKAPEVVNWSNVQSFVAASPFARRYARLLDLALRATKWEQLYDPVLPTIFVNWTKKNEIEFPPALAEKVERRQGTFANWKELYDKLMTLHDETTAGLKKIIDERGAFLDECVSTIGLLSTQLEKARAETANATAAVPVKEQSTREREGMLKVIYAMAAGAYGIDPSTKRSTAVRDIKSDLKRLGLTLSDDTIRRYLQAAADLLPQWQEASR